MPRISPKYQIILIAMLLLFSPISFAEEGYEHGHGAMQLFDDEGMANTPQWVMAWIYFMLASFLASLFFVKNHSEARWVAACFFIGAGILVVSTRILGVPQLSGFIALIHILAWTPALAILIKRRPFLKGFSPYSIWTGVMTFVISFSFVFDIRDASIFLSNYF